MSCNSFNNDSFKIGEYTFSSRLIVGSGKYKSFEETAKATEASGSELITVALQRVDLSAPKSENLLTHLAQIPNLKILPNSAGCYSVKDCVRTALLARELGVGDLFKVEVIGDQKTLFPDNELTIQATKELVKEGFTCLPYILDDPIVAKKCEDVGASAVMPLASAIGSGLGILNDYNLSVIIEQSNVPVIVDAGIGTASDAAKCLELGASAVLTNSAIAHAKNPVAMAEAMKNAVIAGRQAFLAGRMEKKYYAVPTSPQASKFA